MESGRKSEIIRQSEYTEQELRSLGFEKFERKKQVVMVRELREEEAPKRIRMSDDTTIVATTGYKICYMAGEKARNTLNDYPHWPVEPSIFNQTYREWDEPNWQPTPAEMHLMQLGCRPFYKAAHVWAKEIREDTYIQSLEHEKPVLAETGKILAIGVKGEPYTMGDQTFAERYTPAPSGLQRAVQKLVRFFKR
jgi:hypothetical protein